MRELPPLPGGFRCQIPFNGHALNASTTAPPRSARMFKLKSPANAATVLAMQAVSFAKTSATERSRKICSFTSPAAGAAVRRRPARAVVRRQNLPREILRRCPCFEIPVQLCSLTSIQPSPRFQCVGFRQRERCAFAGQCHLAPLDAFAALRLVKKNNRRATAPAQEI